MWKITANKKHILLLVFSVILEFLFLFLIIYKKIYYIFPFTFIGYISLLVYLFSSDFYLKKDLFISKSFFYEKQLPLSELNIQRIGVFRGREFYIKITGVSFSAKYTKKNLEILKIIIPLSPKSPITLEELEKKRRECFIAPR